MRVGVDTGGTFTDVVTDDGTVRKVPSTPGDPSRAVRRCLSRPRAAAREVVGARPRHHGGDQRVAGAPSRSRRLGDDAWLRRRDRDRAAGASVAVRRPRRPSTAARAARAPVRGGRADSTRTGASSSRSTAWSPTWVQSTPSRCACSTPTSTRLTNGRWPRCSARVATRSCARTRCRPSSASTNGWSRPAADAALRAVCAPYLGSLAPIADDVSVMTSAGGLVPLVGGRRASGAPVAVRVPRAACAPPPRLGAGVRLRRRGGVRHGWHQHRRVPGAGRGARAHQHPSRRRADRPAAVTGDPHHRRGWWLGGAPRSRGRARRSDRRARARIPGPACYGRGGTAATVTDADVVLGAHPGGDRAPRISDDSTSPRHAPRSTAPG